MVFARDLTDVRAKLRQRESECKGPEAAVYSQEPGCWREEMGDELRQGAQDREQQEAIQGCVRALSKQDKNPARDLSMERTLMVINNTHNNSKPLSICLMGKGLLLSPLDKHNKRESSQPLKEAGTILPTQHRKGTQARQSRSQLQVKWPVSSRAGL